MPAPSLRLRARLCSLLAVALLPALGCNRDADAIPPDDATTVKAPPTDPQPEPEPAPTDECRSWAGLDTTTLPALPQTPYTATLEKVWVTVLEKHYDPTLNCQDWPAIRVEYGNKLTEAKDDAAAFAVITQMLGRLGQSHLAVVPPRKEVAGEPRAAVKAGDAQVPIEVRVIEGEPVVVDAALHGHKSGIPGGSILLAVDDDQVGPLWASIKAAHGSEGEATFLLRRTVASMLSCPTGASKTLQYQPVGASKPKTKKVKCVPIEGERVSLGNLKNVPASVEHRMIKGTKIGYITFNIWMIPLVAKLEAAMKDLRAQGMESLVIDLRGNPGGVGAMVVPLGRQLFGEDVNLGAMHMREGEQVFKVAAGSDPFTGPLVLLVDEGTASTSEIFGQALQDLGRATVFGAVPSAGAALPSVIEELPGGGMLQFVVADYQSPKGIAVEGKGVQPDTVVPETRKDFAQGHDPVLDAAVAALSQTPKSP